MFRGTGGPFGSEKHSATASPPSGDGGDAEPFGGRPRHARTGSGFGPDGKELWPEGGEMIGRRFIMSSTQSSVGDIVKSFSFCQLVLTALILAQPAWAQKLVDPSTVAPEYRAAAEKRRAEQTKLLDCSRKATAAKVLTRDRAANITQCLESDDQNNPVASHQ
jgi:hypothetical protein